MMLRDPIRQLVEKPGLVLSDSASIETVEWAGELIDSFERPAHDDEAVALLDVLSRSDETSCFGLNWTILHFIETAPGWPLWSALNKVRGEWAENLRQRLRNAGEYPPE